MFPSVISKIIAGYAAEHKLLDWIDEKKLNWDLLSWNPAAIDLLKENPEKINWNHFSENPAAIDLLRENFDKIDWDIFSANKSIFYLNTLDIYYQLNLLFFN